MQGWKGFWVQISLLGYLAREHLGKVPESDKNRLSLNETKYGLIATNAAQGKSLQTDINAASTSLLQQLLLSLNMAWATRVLHPAGVS